MGPYVELHGKTCGLTAQIMWCSLFTQVSYSRTLPLRTTCGERNEALKILIVEDSVPVRHLIKSMLAELAHEIHECSDGSEALAAYKRHRPDFVLMDIQMVLMDGIAATQMIKLADPAAKVVIVTDYDQADLREAARKAGACAYIVKENLLELVHLLQAPASGLT